jgi:hypothetical protein
MVTGTKQCGPYTTLVSASNSFLDSINSNSLYYISYFILVYHSYTMSYQTLSL